jgi:hypothetical protein
MVIEVLSRLNLSVLIKVHFYDEINLGPPVLNFQDSVTVKLATSITNHPTTTELQHDECVLFTIRALT